MPGLFLTELDSFQDSVTSTIHGTAAAMPPSLPVGVVDAMAVNINIDVDFHALRKSQPPLELEGVPPIDPALLDDIVRYDRVLDPGPLDAAFPGTIGSDAEYKNDSMHELAGGDSPPSAELESPPLPKPTNAKSDELKRLWAEHRERPLVDVMDQLRDHLLNQQAGEVDRSKLLFGMLWCVTPSVTTAGGARGAGPR